MFSALKSVWPLLVGVMVLYAGTGMLHTLIVLRARHEGFSTQSIGIIQSAYQMGWLLAAFIVPILIRNVGHIRVFGAVGAVGSAVILMHMLYVEPWSWSLERMIMGLCTAGLMIVAESWLNDMVENKTRGKLLAIYTILSWGTPMIGVAVLRFGDIDGPLFFVLSSVLISIGVVPILISVTRTPRFIEQERLGLTRLYRISPLGVSATLMAGLCHGAFFAAVTLFGSLMGLSTAEVSNLTILALGGGILSQWPIAALSDKVDRRLILLLTASIGAALSAYFFVSDQRDISTLYVGIAAMSASVLGLYSQSISHANDHLKPAQIVPATATLVLVYGIGFAISPLISGYVLAIDPMNFFALNSLLLGLLAAYVLLRIIRRAPAAEQGDYVPVSSASPYAAVMFAAEHGSEEEINYISDYDDPQVLQRENDLHTPNDQNKPKA